jgi:hypothetical protein
VQFLFCSLHLSLSAIELTNLMNDKYNQRTPRTAVKGQNCHMLKQKQCLIMSFECLPLAFLSMSKQSQRTQSVFLQGGPVWGVWGFFSFGRPGKGSTGFPVPYRTVWGKPSTVVTLSMSDILPHHPTLKGKRHVCV